MRDRNIEKLNFRFSARHIGRLDQLACQTGLNRSEVLRALLDRADALLDGNNGCLIRIDGGDLRLTVDQRVAAG